MGMGHIIKEPIKQSYLQPHLRWHEQSSEVKCGLPTFVLRDKGDLYLTAYFIFRYMFDSTLYHTVCYEEEGEDTVFIW